MGLLDEYFGDDEEKDYLMGQIHRITPGAFREFLPLSLEALNKDATPDEKREILALLLEKKEEGGYGWKIKVIDGDIYPDLSSFLTSGELFFLHTVIEGNIVDTDRVPNIWGFLDENDPEFIED